MYPYSKLSIGYQDIWITFQLEIPFSQVRQWLGFLASAIPFGVCLETRNQTRSPFEEKDDFRETMNLGSPNFARGLPNASNTAHALWTFARWIRNKNPPSPPTTTRIARCRVIDGETGVITLKNPTMHKK